MKSTYQTTQYSIEKLKKYNLKKTMKKKDMDQLGLTR
jgi:hypothetical protein